MAYRTEFSIHGIQEAQQRNLKRIAALQPAGEAGLAVRDALVALHRYAVSITHVGKYKVGGVFVGGGSLRASERIEVNGLEGKVFIDPDTKNPRSKIPPVEYAVYENARGGEHAFADRTVNEIGEDVKNRVVTRIKNAVIHVQ